MSTTTLQLPDQFAGLLDALASARYRYGFKLKDIPAGQALLSASPQEQRCFVLAAVARLSIADRCRLTERFLIGRGDLRTYKIHLGSSNILMEPNDRYLRIVPARGGALAGGDGNLFLPFEGDHTLAIILSKALLLAKDSSMQDETILRQIRR